MEAILLDCGARRPQLKRNPLGSRLQHFIMVPDLLLNEAGQEFADLLLQRRPDWAPHIHAYHPVSPDDHTVPGSLWAEISSPAAEGPPLEVLIQPGEAKVALGVRGAEQLFFWNDPPERGDAFQSVLNFIVDIAAGEVVLVWQQHRFFWKRWQTAQFQRAADAGALRGTARVEGWPESAA